MILTNNEYHSRSEISKSDLDLIAKSPFHFKNKHLFRYESKAFDLGSAVHTLVLEPELFEKEYVVSKVDKRTKAGKEMLEYISKNNLTLLSPDDYKIAKEMANSVLSSKFGTLIQNGKAEQSYFGNLNGVDVRCRPDYYREDIGLVIDLKTTIDASSDGFSKSCGNFNYHIQDSFYTDAMKSAGLKVNDFIFIAVEKKPPYMVGAYRLGEPEKDLGREHYEKLLNTYKSCVEKDDFGSNEYSDINTITGDKDYIQTLTLPSYVFYKGI